MEVGRASNTLEANERSLEKTTCGEPELVALTFESHCGAKAKRQG